MDWMILWKLICSGGGEILVSTTKAGCDHMVVCEGMVVCSRDSCMTVFAASAGKYSHRPHYTIALLQKDDDE